MEPPSYMRSVVDRNVVMRRVTVHNVPHYPPPLSVLFVLLSCPLSQRFNCLPNYLGCKRMTSPNVALVSNSKYLILSVAPVRFLMWSPLDNVKCVTVSQRASRSVGGDVCRCIFPSHKFLHKSCKRSVSIFLE